MTTGKYAFASLVLILCIFLLVIFQYNQSTDNGTFVTKLTTLPDREIYLELARELQKERNELSNQLNDARKTIGQYQCQMSKGKTNKLGGWCEAASTEFGGEHMTDLKLIKQLSLFLQGKAVASFGDGPGAYKREIQKLGQVKSFDSFDGAPYCEKTSDGRVQFMDLTIPQFGRKQYDWVMSLEVAEHIPHKFENIYLDNIFRHAREGILLSWAVPGQGGLDHINNRPLDYVINIMDKNGFYIDRAASKQLQDSAELPWIKSNLNVYKRKQLEPKGNLLDTWFI